MMNACIGYENGCFCHLCCVRDNTPPENNLPILEWDTVKCTSCNRFFSEGDIIRHCVEEHPDSLVARVVALAREDETA